MLNERERVSTYHACNVRNFSGREMEQARFNQS